MLPMGRAGLTDIFKFIISSKAGQKTVHFYHTMTKDFWFKNVDPLESTVAIAIAYEQNYIPKQCRCYSSSEM